jgi:hypothetical protein
MQHAALAAVPVMGAEVRALNDLVLAKASDIAAPIACAIGAAMSA